VLSTTVGPSSAKASISASTSCLAPGSRLAVGSSRKQHARARGPGAGQGQPLLLPAGELARGARRLGEQPHPRQRLRRAPGVLGPGHAASHRATRTLACADRCSRNGRWNSMAPSGPARLAPGPTAPVGAAAASRVPSAGARRAVQQPQQGASCPSRWRRPGRCARRGAPPG
jgi:hypothetical protein